MTEQKPGLHHTIKGNIANFSEEEKKIIYKLAEEWYVTNAGEFSIGPKSRYNYALIKATPTYRNMFGFEKELIVIFSRYKNFEPRSIDAIDTLYQSVLDRYQVLRIERICSILFSEDSDIERKISDLLRESQESQVIVPISYQEIIDSSDAYFLRNKFKDNFYKRNLFDFTSPLKKDLYFFGRTDLINKLGDRHSSHENSGVFGLRRSGKTSLIFAVQRQMDLVGNPSVLISCDDVSFQQRRWNECLYYILDRLVDKYKRQNQLKVSLSSVDLYTEKDAASLFEKDILKIYNRLGKKPILIVFDEIERITFNTATVEHWKSGEDFIFFWQTLKSKFNTLDKVFSYLIVGTNPTCIEKSKIRGIDNPIFHSISIQYLEQFDVHQTRHMVSTIGKFLGLTFEEIIYSKLVEDYGGHPFLVRQICSLIYQRCKQQLPITVDRAMYNKAKDDFDQEKSLNYISMILEVLTDFYPDEHTMLTYLAIEDIDFFNSLANDSPEYVTHLIGYGIISRNQNADGYDFKIDAVQKYLQNRNRYKKLSCTPDEIRHEICQRRTDLELKLRKIIQGQLLGYYDVEKAKSLMIENLKSRNKLSSLESLTYPDLFDPSKVKIYFFNLKEIIVNEWGIFQRIFRDQDHFKKSMETINDFRKVDAHAQETVTDNEFINFRTKIGWIENCLLEWKKLTG
ncbi:ATP-binding protein [Planktothrix pseudagardhii]|uniref:ATP-binding protein n=1 Tax=Planktothrix pseudagardhii TaxID=132604 RepID=A0A9W4CN62_9CYAN|nr:ATP-binding protein [Planktothrix pseudagardhii]CAD5962013.1 hypothetical protein NO713_03262 [Planktothrix pseudagardhii]